MGLVSDKKAAGGAQRPKRLEDGVYIGECLSVTTGKWEEDGSSGQKFVLNYAFRSLDPEAQQSLIPFDKPTAKFEIKLPQDKEIFIGLFGKRLANGKLSGGLHQWSGKGGAIPSGEVELTIKGQDGGKKQNGSGFWDPTYRVVDIDALGASASRIEDAIGSLFDDPATDPPTETTEQIEETKQALKAAHEDKKKKARELGSR